LSISTIKDPGAKNLLIFYWINFWKKKKHPNIWLKTIFNQDRDYGFPKSENPYFGNDNWESPSTHGIWLDVKLANLRGSR